MRNNVKSHDVMVLEAGCNSFEFVKTAKSLGLNAIVLDSVKVGQLSKSYCKNDSIDAVKTCENLFNRTPRRSLGSR